MVEKKMTKKEKTESRQVELKEILGDIKNVVSGEKETLFKVSKYKTIKLKTENLVKSGKKNDALNTIGMIDEKLENLIRNIVKDEIKNFAKVQKLGKLSTENANANKNISNSPQLEKKAKPIGSLRKMTKKELEEYGRTFGFEVDRRLTKDKIIKQVNKLK